MRQYRQITKAEPAVVEFLLAHEKRLDPKQPPAAVFVAEDDGDVRAALLMWARPAANVSVVMGAGAGAMTLTKLALAFEAWAATVGLTQYVFYVHWSDLAYRRIVEHRGAVEQGRDGEYVVYLQPLKPGERKVEDGIRPWAPGDTAVLNRLMRAFLQEHYDLGGDFKPTERNVAAFVKTGLIAADMGDPALLLTHEGKPAGFVLWNGLPAHVDFDLREKIVHGFGTYIIPEFRQRGLSKTLRNAAMQVARAKGYTRLDGISIDERGFKAGLSVGGKAAGVLVRRSLKE